MLVERFDSKEARAERLAVLKAKGYQPNKLSTEVPATWKTQWIITYQPEQRKRRKR
jgi:hypothetical protein